MKKEVTIKDIAKELGIHHATVSRALQGSTKVNENTRNMILQAARNNGIYSQYFGPELPERKNESHIFHHT